MQRQPITYLLLCFVAAASTPASGASQTFSEQSFSSWTDSRTFLTPGSSSSFQAVGTSGNPAPCLLVSNSPFRGDAAIGIWDTNNTWQPAIQGEIHAVSLDVEFQSGSGAFGQGQAVCVLIVQDNRFFVGPMTPNGVAQVFTGVSSTWQPISAHSIPRTGFMEIFGAAEVNTTSHPDFSTTASDLTFGLLLWNSSSNSYTLANAYDNLQIDVCEAITASCTLSNGSGINPVALSCVSRPVLGTNWNTEIARNPSTLSTHLGLAIAPAQIFVPAFGGEVLIDLAPPTVLLSGIGLHSVFLPNDCALMGLVLYSQGFRVDAPSGVPDLVLLNAQRLILGT